jgi:hypothetical protein
MVSKRNGLYLAQAMKVYTVQHVRLQACIRLETCKTLSQRIAQQAFFIDASDQYLIGGV